MPIKPQSGETEQEFVSRCIPVEIESGYPQEQAAAICYSIYRQEEMKSAKGTAKKVKLKYDYIQTFKGINLEYKGASLEDACWEGYIAIGTKELNGREVPNCVPEEGTR